jgi:hypothetical protein
LIAVSGSGQLNRPFTIHERSSHAIHRIGASSGALRAVARLGGRIQRERQRCRLRARVVDQQRCIRSNWQVTAVCTTIGDLVRSDGLTSDRWDKVTDGLAEAYIPDVYFQSTSGDVIPPDCT